MLNLTRPLAVIDVEATGTSTEHDRVIELAIVKLFPDTGAVESWSTRVHPGMPIPPESTAVHGITDADVVTARTFEAIALDIAARLEGCDLGGFNLRAFDVPILRAEFERAGLAWPCGDAHLVDAFVVFRDREPRTLSAAVRWYCGRELVGAHGAEADARATLDVILAQVERYPDLPRDVAALDGASGGRQPDWATELGHLRWNTDGELVIGFGKHKGRLARDMDDGFLGWIRRQDFPSDVKALALAVMRGERPRAPWAAPLVEPPPEMFDDCDDIPF